ncbi:hypothetical protein [Methanosarcina vacuolata]|uniref:hypothetical protein n=1 Tax=Methanosarcina vacuolata TaxID=2215 RepID=UPI00064FA460|nr:hypothetical protein [Methanosarcina vacuolata]
MEVLKIEGIVVESSVGYDYGIKPRLMIIGDMEFPRLLRDGFIALGYGYVPQFGNLSNAPLLIMMFNDENLAEECFSRFNSWCYESKDGDAIAISFIEFETGDYGVCVYPDLQQIINRSIPKIYASDIEPIVVATGFFKKFSNISGSYTHFKSVVEALNFVLAPGTLNYGSILDLGIIKKRVNFYKENEISEQTMESLLLQSCKSNDLEKPFQTPLEAKTDLIEIYKRRETQLSRFFPVSLEYLRFNFKFLQMKNQLNEKGYYDWQIYQATCNIILKYRVPELFDKDTNLSNKQQKDKVQIEVLKYLCYNFEDISLSYPSLDFLLISEICEQIKADSFELICYLDHTNLPKQNLSPEETQSELIRLCLSNK